MIVESFVPHILALFILFFIAVISAIFLRRVNIPYTIGLVLIGLAMAYAVKDVEALDFIADIRLTHDVIVYVLLPTLIFDAATNIDARLLFKNLVPILSLAIPGLVISTLIVGLTVNYLTPLHLGTAILFGALISATDPVAVVALFEKLGAPERLTILVDGESLFNDATAIVLFNIIVAMIITDTSFSVDSVYHGIFEFITVFFGGLIIGAVTGYIVIQIIKFSKNDPLVQLALSTILAYSAFILAEYYLDVSGVMAVLAAGIMLSWHGSTRFTGETKQYLKHFWEYAAFVCNSFIFLLLGVAELHLFTLIGHSNNLIFYIAAAIIAVTIARIIVVFWVPYVLSFKSEKIDNKYKTVIFWGGLRGAVPLALALSLSRHFEGEQLIVELTLGVVLFTLLVQGSTVKSLIKFLKLQVGEK
jgi:monovalent cation:H+ antiporter, CPA1 family